MPDCSTVEIHTKPEHGETLAQVIADHGAPDGEWRFDNEQEDTLGYAIDSDCPWGSFNAGVVAIIAELERLKVPHIVQDSAHYCWSPHLVVFDGETSREIPCGGEGEPLMSRMDALEIALAARMHGGTPESLVAKYFDVWEIVK